MDLYRPTSLSINLKRLIENFKFLQSLLRSSSFLCPMIKANAYGHGDVEVAKALSQANCSYLGVSSVEEGVHLREHHVSENILVFGFYGRQAVRAMVEHNLTPVVSDFDQLSDLCLQQGRVNLHLKFNTGMNRLGFNLSEASGVRSVLQKNNNLNLEGIGTHFHTGALLSQEGSAAWQQDKEFKEICKMHPDSSLHFHAYNSAAVASLYKSRKTFSFGMRPGLLVYGIDPDKDLSLKPLVSPVMEFKSKIVATQQVKSGEVVSYGGIWQANQNSLIGIVPAGYADGVCRSLSNRGHFLVKGQRVPICGRVCMDYTMVDLTQLNVGSPMVGEEVVLIGKQGNAEILVEDVAEVSGRVSYEVMTGISERVPRFYGVS